MQANNNHGWIINTALELEYHFINFWNVTYVNVIIHNIVFHQIVKRIIFLDTMLQILIQSILWFIVLLHLKACELV